jgi:hypothetical protein
VIEALAAHTIEDRRILDRIAVVEVCPDSRVTMKRYRELHRQHPDREYCFAHTGMAELDIEEHPWARIRAPAAARAAR